MARYVDLLAHTGMSPTGHRQTTRLLSSIPDISPRRGLRFCFLPYRQATLLAECTYAMDAKTTHRRTNLNKHSRTRTFIIYLFSCPANTCVQYFGHYQMPRNRSWVSFTLIPLPHTPIPPHHDLLHLTPLIPLQHQPLLIRQMQQANKAVTRADVLHLLLRIH